MKRGRPSLPEGQKQTKNVTLEADMVEALNLAADELAKVFGFRPTLSQTVRHLIKKARP